MSEVFLIPSFLADNAIETIPAYVVENLKKCKVIFAENERTTRRFMKAIDKSFDIDSFEWFTIHQAEEDVANFFRDAILQKKNVAIVSEAGCPGIADPGQKLVAIAQHMNAVIHPLVGPSSILLALMASGMNGQSFEFLGYLPVEKNEREAKIRQLESSSAKTNSTKIFIETPYRNNQMLDSLLHICQPNVKLCIGINITSTDESIKTKTIADWKKSKPDLHKKPVIFLLYAG